MSEGLKTQLQRVGFDVVGTIRDAGNDLGIFINPKDIDRGQPGNPMKCTAARCLQRAVGEPGVKVAVFLHTAYVQWPGIPSVRRYVVPEKLRRDVVIPTDEGTLVKPGDYTLKAPKGAARIGQSVERRERLAKQRAEGTAPPQTKRTGPTKRHVRVRWQRSV